MNTCRKLITRSIFVLTFIHISKGLSKIIPSAVCCSGRTSVVQIVDDIAALTYIYVYYPCDDVLDFD